MKCLIIIWGMRDQIEKTETNVRPKKMISMVSRVHLMVKIKNYTL